MNIVRFNDSFERFLANYPIQEYLGIFKGWQHAPLFDYVTTYEHERDQVSAIVNGEMKVAEIPWPFELFRLGLAETAVPWKDEVIDVMIGKGRYATNFIAARRQGRVAVVAEIKELWDEEYQVARNEKLCFVIEGVEREVGDELKFNFSMSAEGEWQRIDDAMRVAVQPIVGGALTGLFTFLVDSMAPTTHIARVQPAQEHRSVQWLQARTHYTLITHGHAANRAGLTQGERVASKREDELRRMAHNRRAHFRTLKHERYRFARGKRVFVRSTWVGPREWQDEGGRQVYRILEPMKND